MDTFDRLTTPRASAQDSSSQAFSVSEVNALVADVLSAQLPVAMSVEGEISNLSVAASGHRYFSLKDAQSTISCALFRGAAQRISRTVLHDLKNGDRVIVRASMSVYQPRGSYQLIASSIEPAGFGALAQAFSALKNKLDTAGLTAAERKQPIPTWPKHVAVVTSATGAAVRDVLTTLRRRSPFINVTVYPTLVQGLDAPQNIVQALVDAHKDTTHDVILLVRGGGSLEDLHAFNDERVAMAVVQSRIPIISGVGHETDFTIVDFVSDLRAATPTAAAECASPDKQSLQQDLSKRKQRLAHAANLVLQQRQRHLIGIRQRLLVQHPQRQLQEHNQRLDELSLRLQRFMLLRINHQRQYVGHCLRQLHAVSPQHQLVHAQEQLQRLQRQLRDTLQQVLERSKSHVAGQQQRLSLAAKGFERHQNYLKGLEARLLLLSPLGILDRGYALAFAEDGRLVRDAALVSSGQRLHLRLAQGDVTVVVDKP